MLEKLQGFVVDYPIFNPNTNQNYTASELLATKWISISCLESQDFDGCAINSLFESLIPKPNKVNLLPSEIEWLKYNFEYYQKAKSFANNRTDLSLEARDLAIETYVKLLSTDPAIEELDALWLLFQLCMAFY
ncbi:MAG: hypothetical protein IPH89_14995 [Bacteroidetes bacterium]|nr:hypothetical protein [Bacteroidota bacterium]